MIIDRNEIKSNYSIKSINELFHYLKTQDLTSDALEVLNEVLIEKGVDKNKVQIALDIRASNQTTAKRKEGLIISAYRGRASMSAAFGGVWLLGNVILFILFLICLANSKTELQKTISIGLFVAVWAAHYLFSIICVYRCMPNARSPAAGYTSLILVLIGGVSFLSRYF